MSVPNSNEIPYLVYKQRLEAELKRLDEVDGSVEDTSLVSKFTQGEAKMGIIPAKPGKEDDQGLDNSVEPTSVNPITYYGVNTGLTNENQDDQKLNVFTDKLEALKAVKQYKKSRFKVFKTREEAEEFALFGGVTLENTSVLGHSEPSNVHVGEKPSLYKGPKAQDLVRLRKAIETGDLHMVESTVWENPRYLISSGDTPSILQEGSRYNALHVATKAKNSTMTEFIIQTIADPKFVELLYGDDNMESCKGRVAILLDLYLNTPDKGLNETPLHFACKFGALDVVEVLVSYPQCDKTSRNKYGQSPKDITCSRVNPPNPSLKVQICSHLEELFYVPVLRAEDNSLQPTIGLPFSPSRPTVVNQNLVDSRIEIRAYAGPMPEEQATEFRKKWKTPPRNNTEAGGTNRRMCDTEKGLECVGRDLAQEFNVGWKEYWPFMGTFTNLSSTEGFEKLEAHLAKRFYQAENPDVSTHSDDATLVETNEVDSGNALSPMSELCVSLQSCNLNLDTSREDTNRLANNKWNHNSVAKSTHTNQEEQNLMNMLTNPGLSPFLYVEKSCQVFGKRIADGLSHIASGGLARIGEQVSDMLKQEMKRLQALINSYRDDPRFVSVDFHLIHSRIAAIINRRLSGLPVDDCDYVLTLCSQIKAKQLTSYGSSDEEEFGHRWESTDSYRSQSGVGKTAARDAISSHVTCIAQHIVRGSTVEQNSNVKNTTEEDCMSVWSDAVKCSCQWQTPSFVRNSRKTSSYKRLKYSANKLMKNDIVPLGRVKPPRRLAFDSVQDAWTDEEKSEESARESDSEDDSAFFTPASSPRKRSPEQSDSEGMSSAEEGEEVYIEGDCPTMTDVAVVQAIEQCRIAAADYPNIFRWRHMMLLHPADERASWGSPQRSRLARKAQYQTDTPSKTPARQFHPLESWHRVIPPSSPNSPHFRRDQARF